MSLDPQQYAIQWLNTVFKPDVENKVQLVSGLNTATDSAVSGSLQTVAGQMNSAADASKVTGGDASKVTGGDASKVTGGDASKVTGGDASKVTGGDASKGTGSGTKDMGTAGVWRPGDIANVIDSASKITGNIPDLIKAIGSLDDDVDDIIKAGGEAIKSGGQGIATVLDSVDKMDNQTNVGAASGGDSTSGGGKPSGGDSTSGGGKPSGGDSTSGGGKPSGGDSTSGGGKPSGGDSTSGGGKPSGGDSPTGGGKPSGGDSPTGGGNPSGAPAAGAPASISQPSSLMGLPPVRSQSDSEQEHRRDPRFTPSAATSDQQEVQS